ncbi:LysR family transcriptional regulator [Gammaproteobacteria bacterium 45_16_T64]|nr:LysR family transcriptional regulator [Gammaproteobacteria bacterium 45_16_T64]
MTKNPIKIEVLEILDAIDRRGSFAKAADELNKATSAISYGVQKLEEQLDIALFRRQGRRSVLTPAGRLILDEGRVILNSTARLAIKAKEVATGWEPRIRIAIESLQSYPDFFRTLAVFLDEHDSIEIDVSECVLNGGWEALEHDRVDLIVGSPGPVPMHKGYRTIQLCGGDLVPVIASHHRFANIANEREVLTEVLPKLRRIVAHDTSVDDVVRSEGLSREGQKLYVQNTDQKVEAILAGIGIGHLPYQRIGQHLDSGKLVALNLGGITKHDAFLAWKISHKGKGLQALVGLLEKSLSK